MASEELATINGVLVVELPLVEIDVLPGEQQPQLGKCGEQQPMPLLGNDENEVVDKAHQVEAAIFGEPNDLVVDVEAHAGLPYQPSDGGTHALGLGHDALLGFDVLIPKVGGSPALAVRRRVAVHRDHGEPLKVGLVVLVASEAVYDPVDALLRHVPKGVREETLVVDLHDAGGPGVALRHVEDVLHELVDGGLRALPLAVVVGVW